MPDESDSIGDWQSGDVEVAQEEPKVRRPPLYKVIVLNDDYTPRDFVVGILQRFFGMDREKAYQIMMAVHRSGSGIAGIFPRDVAEMKSEQVNRYAQANQHPLITTIERADSE